MFVSKFVDCHEILLFAHIGNPFIFNQIFLGRVTLLHNDHIGELKNQFYVANLVVLVELGFEWVLVPFTGRKRIAA